MRTQMLLALLVGVVTLLVGAGVMYVLVRRPSWCAPFAGAMAAMMLLLAVVWDVVAGAGL
ncbi:hypothetical protein [Streptomyces sp. NPDC055140]